ncbi:hypothetical protein Q5P01_023746 [Channa striata]|uniref:Uncharacterized protein n=1 Tax=Channa striata TaxID=64152 RepID=A0AA88LQK3_CHASR|nr:hypothetical protein Q5P01_023746 [Channa striata]
MEGRCAVEIWAEFGFSETPFTPKVQTGSGTDVFLCTGSDEVYVFSTDERKLTAVLTFPGAVSDLVESHDKQRLYVSCRNGVYCVNLPFLLSRTQGSSSPAELKISSEFLVVGEEGALSLLLVGSVLLILSHRDTSWLLSLYKTPKEAQRSSYEKLSSFSLPLVSAVVKWRQQIKNRSEKKACADLCPFRSYNITTFVFHYFSRGNLNFQPLPS